MILRRQASRAITSAAPALRPSEAISTTTSAPSISSDSRAGVPSGFDSGRSSVSALAGSTSPPATVRKCAPFHGSSVMRNIASAAPWSSAKMREARVAAFG